MLARNRGKAIKLTIYNVVTVYTGSKDYVTKESATFTQLVEPVTLTSVKLQQDQEADARPTMPVL